MPEYDPDYWVSGGYYHINNCYNYACDMRKDSPAQPGIASGIQMPPYPKEWTDCQFLIDAVLADGLVPASFEEPCFGCSHKVAMVLSEYAHGVKGLYVDYHFYRENPDDGNGITWSHMFQHEKPSRHDASGVLITNPEYADRDYSRDGFILDYRSFCGFYCVDVHTVNIE